MTGIYFSGTGNTKFCITRFVEKSCGGAAYPIEDKEAAKVLSDDEDIALGYPVYYSNLPKIARDFIEQNAELWRGKNVFIIATMGLFSGDGSGVRCFSECPKKALTIIGKDVLVQYKFSDYT